MLDLRQIHSLTDFLRNHKTHVQRLQLADVPEVLTVNGKPELVIQSAGGYQSLLDRLEYAEGVAGLRKAYRQVKRGETEDYRTAIQSLKTENGL
jgi:PHD/YefM family antitoxin component YafN of YafNO toxin-antitoxin module